VYNDRRRSSEAAETFCLSNSSSLDPCTRAKVLHFFAYLTAQCEGSSLAEEAEAFALLSEPLRVEVVLRCGWTALRRLRYLPEDAFDKVLHGQTLLTRTFCKYIVLKVYAVLHQSCCALHACNNVEWVLRVCVYVIFPGAIYQWFGCFFQCLLIVVFFKTLNVFVWFEQSTQHGFVMALCRRMRLHLVVPGAVVASALASDIFAVEAAAAAEEKAAAAAATETRSSASAAATTTTSSCGEDGAVGTTEATKLPGFYKAIDLLVLRRYVWRRSLVQIFLFVYEFFSCSRT
jgi:hypothetical protein